MVMIRGVKIKDGTATRTLMLQALPSLAISCNLLTFFSFPNHSFTFFLLLPDPFQPFFSYLLFHPSYSSILLPLLFSLSIIRRERRVWKEKKTMEKDEKGLRLVDTSIQSENVGVDL